MNQNALDAYVAKIHELARKAESLAQYTADHGGFSPEEINWGHVGSLAYANEQLNDVLNFLGIVPESTQPGE